MNYVLDGEKAIFNVSSGLENYSQRNNIYVLKRKINIVNLTNVCNTTSICMGSSYSGWRFPSKPFPQYKQEEDRLTAFCLEDKRVSDFYKKYSYQCWKEWQDDKQDALPPNQVHRVLEYATNLWFGEKVVEFSENRKVPDMLKEIVVDGLPVVVSGLFPKRSDNIEKIGHIVVLVGAIYDKKNIQEGYQYNPERLLTTTSPTHLIFDDPWGNFMEGYEKMKSGNDVVCPYSLALRYLKPTNSLISKWGYFFNKGAAIS
jgi:hypothetical protein